jgi:hypothetical protein
MTDHPPATPAQPGTGAVERPCHDLHGDNQTRTPHYHAPDHLPATPAQLGTPAAEPDHDDGGMHTVAGALAWLVALAGSPVHGDERWVTTREARLVLVEVNRLAAERDEQERRAERMRGEAEHWTSAAAEAISERGEARAALERVRALPDQWDARYVEPGASYPEASPWEAGAWADGVEVGFARAAEELRTVLDGPARPASANISVDYDGFATKWLDVHGKLRSRPVHPASGSEEER